MAKLRDRIEYQERDSSFLKVTLEQEQSYKQQTEEKCTNLMDEKRQLIAKYVLLPVIPSIYMYQYTGPSTHGARLSYLTHSSRPTNPLGVS